MGSDHEAFAERYLTGKLAEVDRALAELDAQPDPLNAHDARRRLVALRAQIVAALAVSPR